MENVSTTREIFQSHRIADMQSFVVVTKTATITECRLCMTIVVRILKKRSDYVMNNENRYIALARHAIGLDHKEPYKRHGKLFYRPYRNYYDASPKDCETWELMCDAGYADRGRKDRYGGRMYWLTRKGLDWLGEKLGIKIYDEED